jgi:hypothetical protein
MPPRWYSPLSQFVIPCLPDQTAFQTASQVSCVKISKPIMCSTPLSWPRTTICQGLGADRKTVRLSIDRHRRP